MRFQVVTLVTLCSLIGYSAGHETYDAEDIRELLAEQREELTVILKQQNETHQQQIIALQQQVEVLQLKDEILQQELEIQQQTNEELQATVYSLLKAVSLNYKIVVGCFFECMIYL